MFKWLEKYFTFSKGERNAIVLLIVLCFCALLAPRIYFWFKPVQHIIAPDKNDASGLAIDSTDEPESDSIPIVTLDVNAPLVDSTTLNALPVKNESKRRGGGYFEFDPNKIGIDEWVKLGFSPKQAAVIEKYKAHGGKFYRTEDLMRLYVMDEEHYNKLRPYVRIDKDALPKRSYKRE